MKEKTVAYASLKSGISPVEMVASLRKGSTAQANLIGYLKETKRALTAEINEKFGSQTLAAVLAFQKQQNLTQDGVAGKKTLTALETAVMNGANEVAVGAFLEERVGFNDIPALVETALSEVAQVSNPALSDILDADRLARESVRSHIQ